MLIRLLGSSSCSCGKRCTSCRARPWLAPKLFLCHVVRMRTACMAGIFCGRPTPAGVVNGIDCAEWSPETDAFLKGDGYANYSMQVGPCPWLVRAGWHTHQTVPHMVCACWQGHMLPTVHAGAAAVVGLALLWLCAATVAF